MLNISASFAKFGAETLPKIYPVKAGYLSAYVENGTLRHVHFGNQLTVLQIYSAVRDYNWSTIPAILDPFTITQDDKSFDIRFTSHHKTHEVDFVWDGEIIGTADSEITFSMRGIANNTFKRNRIGFCILHPHILAGKTCLIEHVDGTTSEVAFPLNIAPHQPFFNIRSIIHSINPDLLIEVRMEGDTFELEDQRNWGDASYKTYCTPLSQPFPQIVEMGTVLEQKITIRLLNPVKQVNASNEKITLQVNPEKIGFIHNIGVSLPSHDEPHAPEQIQRLKTLKLAHLRTEWQTDSPNLEAKIIKDTQQALELKTPLEVALILGENPLQELTTVKALSQSHQAPVASWFIFRKGELTTSAKTIHIARYILGAEAMIVSGTDAFFTQLNRDPVSTSHLNAVSYSINPTIHAVDLTSMTETLPVIGQQVESATSICHNKPVCISPVTFKMRWNPDATAPDPATPPTELPRQVDVRQMTLFGACWTLGVLKYTSSLPQIHSVTLFETTGWLGIMSHPHGSPLMDKFPAPAHSVYPIYHVLRELQGVSMVYETTSTQPLLCEVLAFHRDGKVAMMIANFHRDEHTVTLDGIEGQFNIRILDETTYETATLHPDEFAHQFQQTQVEVGFGTQLTLKACSIMILEEA
jgi:D-apionolactonase